MLQPCYILRRYVAVCHADHRTRVKANKEHAIVGKGKAAIAEHATKVHHARLRPRGLMVARSGIERHIQLLQCIFDGLDRGAVARLGEVARYHHELNRGILIDICNRALQIFHRTGVASADMGIGQQRKRK